MCDIIRKLHNFCESKGIVAENELAYKWNDPKRSEEVDTRFKGFCDNISDAVKQQNHEKLATVIGEIFTWGGVGSNVLKELYTQRLLDGDFAIYNDDWTTNWKNVCRSSQINRNGKFKSPEWASWSKVLAAYTFNETDNNKKFFIYDSRVAKALSIIDPDYPWFLPSEYGHSVVFAMIKQSRNGRRTYAAKSYKRYCEALRNQGGVTLERQLFMLGGYLDYTPPEDWRTHIDVKIPENKKKQ